MRLVLAALLAACTGPVDPGDPVCTPGEDRTCNLNFAVSSLHGHCEDDATCTCGEGFVKDETTGLCY